MNRVDALLKELRMLPEDIKLLEEDAQALRSSVLTSPQWSDMRVSGGLKQSQTDKYANIIDTTDYHRAEIDRLKKRKEFIVSLIMHITDIETRRVVLVTYNMCKNYDDAMDKLDIRFRNKYFMLLRKGKEELDSILNQYENNTNVIQQ